MRIFLDANLLFSAAMSDGAVRQLLVLQAKSGHECCVDGYAIEEARRNLAAKAPDRVVAVERRLSCMKTAGAQRSDAALEASLPLPTKDRPVLTAAIRQSCTAPVTGDRTHFGARYGRTIHGMTIHSPRSLAEALVVWREFAAAADGALDCECDCTVVMQWRGVHKRACRNLVPPLSAMRTREAFGEYAALQ
jgi:hypothetical protein